MSQVLEKARTYEKEQAKKIVGICVQHFTSLPMWDG